MGYYIKGQKNRGKEVIELLKSKGGIINETVSGVMTGDMSYVYYYIGNDNIIHSACDAPSQVVVSHFCKELFLSEPKVEPKFQVGDIVCCQKGQGLSKHFFQGMILGIKDGEYNIDNRGWFAEKQIIGTVTKEQPTCKKYKVGDKVISNNDGEIGVIEEIGDTRYKVKYNKYAYQLIEESMLTPADWLPKRGETVLVRNDIEYSWLEAVFSFKKEKHYYTVGGDVWRYCRPFDENLLGKIGK